MKILYVLLMLIFIVKVDFPTGQVITYRATIVNSGQPENHYYSIKLEDETWANVPKCRTIITEEN